MDPVENAAKDSSMYLFDLTTETQDISCYFVHLHPFLHFLACNTETKYIVYQSIKYIVVSPHTFVIVGLVLLKVYFCFLFPCHPVDAQGALSRSEESVQSVEILNQAVFPPFLINWHSMNWIE